MVFRQARWEEKLLIELGRSGRVGYVPPQPVSNDVELDIPDWLKRKKLDIPSLSEVQVVRHFVRLSQMNYAVDTGMYPLGSCTMKFNPKLNDRIATNPKVENAHPYQEHSTVQGLLSILYELSTALASLTGMDDISLMPAAGAQGELAGVLMIKKYLEVKGLDGERREIIIPDSAHGTNPASAAMANFDVVTVPSDKRGMVDLDRLKGLVGRRTAGMMMTVPNTLGLFEGDILKISKLVHDNGGLMYYDGANMNAILGRVRPGDMGFDIVHLNLHKTFSTPHGGGGPGAGPIGVKSFLRDYLPVPVLEKTKDGFRWKYDLQHSIGRIRGAYGNIGVLVRAYSYMVTLGPQGVRDVSGHSVLSSNYLMRRLSKEGYETMFGESIPRKHEFVVSARPLAKKGSSALRVAKALLDMGFHSPTIYFPLIVDEALMVEPTESEPVENLNAYADALNQIARQIIEDPEKYSDSPKNASSGPLDEARASHPLTIRLTWRGLGGTGGGSPA
jgi:glycine dehydrogenase subunit 2